MDYEKKYEEALERAKSEYQTHKSFKGFREMLAHIFPELAESEDEKTRKAIIESLPKYGYLPQTSIKVEDAIAWLEKQGEQKPTIIISKFRAGDWIVNNDSGVIQHIKEIVNVNDETLYVFDEDSVLDINFQGQYHLWTIEDAKDGDVLIDEDANVIGIFEGVKGMWWRSKFYYSSFTKELYGIECGGLHQKEFAKPATKEQRDLLFSNMKEAGYVWDAEKKELNGIATYCQEPCKGYQETGRCFIDGECKASKSQCMISAEAKEALYDKPTWSEEDKDYYDAIITKLEVTQDDAALTDNQMNFLKSLKDRIVPQLQQEWSKEDEKRFNSCINILKPKSLWAYADALNVKWLKSLKDRVQPQTWKPSDEQMKALHDINLTGNISYAGQGQVLIELYNDLKKLTE